MDSGALILKILGFVGSAGVFTLVSRIVKPPEEDSSSLTKIAPKGPGDVSAFENLNPHGGIVDRLDFFLVHTARFGPKIETVHMHLGKPDKPTPLNMLHIKEIVAVMVAGFTYLMSDSWQLALALFPIGFFLPDQYFKGQIKERQRQIIRNFPSFVDLAALTIESGLDYMSAFEKIVQAALKKSELEIEIERMTAEISLGYSRRDALRRLAMRTGLPEFRSFVGLIVQSDELGTSLVQLLRNYSGDMRFRRLNAAEQAAAQAATKMLIPIFFFIFPTVFILMLSPMMMSVYNSGGLGF